MVSLAFALASLCSAPIQPKALVTLPNGARIYSEYVANARNCSVQLWVSSAGTEERPETNGWRHLLEHCLGSGEGGSTDIELEKQGLMMLAETSRDAMMFRIDCPPAKVDRAIEFVVATSNPVRITPEWLAMERQSIINEESLLPSYRRFSRTAWGRILGPASPDPFGEPESISAATPADLQSIQQKMFCGPNIALVITGPIDPTQVSETARVIVDRAKLPSTSAATMPGAKVDSLYLPVGVAGSALVCRLPSIDDRQCLALVAAGLGIQSAVPGTQIVFTPSSRAGVITLTSKSPGIQEQVIKVGDFDLSFGIDLIQSWVQGIRRNPAALASFRGSLLCRGSNVTLEAIEKGAQTLTITDLQSAKQRLQTGVVIGGLN